MKLYVHKMTVRYTDYGDLLETVHGIAWSSDGEDPMGFERSKTVDQVRAKALAISSTIEIVEGKPVSRTHDMNPHGLI